MASLASLQGAALVHFQDFNAEVLRCLTIPNVKANLFKESSETSRSVGFYAGDWSEIDKLLLRGDAVQDKTTNLHTENEGHRGYNIILMAETVYALDSLPSLYRLIKKCLHYPSGVVYMAGKKHYFGVGGGTRQFLRLVTEDGAMQSDLLAEVTDGSSNVREKLRWSRITSVLLPRKVSEPSSSKIRHASVAHAEDACPSIVFLSQWGLPVLSGPSVAGNRGKHSRGKGY
ncbi:hypothetical protein TRIUR3_09094 [Triticum urartu]|uniref:protein-histidine N-methyltransferase n=2 Tax=Triticum TaxID=4564 RepID=A0A9R0WP30_TRITD|nr:hypothetical protein TRIUR3_09094 [Triticum urartu]VAI17615.1 unnamed protein product [Triticum turgidum subsp. durum]